MREGTSERSRIERETVRALLVANGAGAVVMLALLPMVLDKSGYQTFTRGLLIGLLVMMAGVVLAIVHNHLRARIMPAAELPQNVRPQQNMGSQQQNPGSQQSFGQQSMRPAPAAEAKPPRSNLAIASMACMWLSVVAFLGAGAFVAVSGIDTLSEFQNRSTQQQPTATVGEQKAKAKR